MPEMKQRLRRSITLPVVLFVIVLLTIISLTVLWHVVLFKDYAQIRELSKQAQAGGQPFHWAILAIGSGAFVSIIILLSILSSQLFSEIRWNERQQNFIASVSHELNSPLSSIKLYAQTLRGDVTPEDRARFLQVILSDVDRLAYLIQNILRAATIDQLPVRVEAVPLAPYLEAYHAEIASRFARRGRGDEIVLDPVDPDLIAYLDRALFRQVLDNLVDNAAKYSKGGRSRIQLTATRSESRCTISVRDDGLGIPLNELSKIFDRFYRIEGDAQRSRKGTGLGLFIVRSIVEGHGGTVEAASEGSGLGSTFKIDLPLGAPLAQDDSGDQHLATGELPASAPA